MSPKTRFWTAILGVIIVAAAIAYAYAQRDDSAPKDLSYDQTPAGQNNSQTPAKTPPTPSDNTTPPTPDTSTPIPNSFSLKVPFTPQAPTGNWDTLHNEACEEASAIMAHAYFSGDTRAKIPAPEVEKEISFLTDWLQERFGYYLNTDAAETAQMIEGAYNLKTRIIKNFTESQLKAEIAAGNVVILPANGRLLGNPNYKQPGPIYHMIVIRGYTSTKIITNDPGTRNGENYTYTFDTLQKAAADWDHSINTVDGSKKLIIVVSK